MIKRLIVISCGNNTARAAKLHFSLMLIPILILICSGTSIAAESNSDATIQFKRIPFLSYSIDNENIVLKVDYRDGWGYQVVRFRFPDRLVLDISFKSGTPKEFNPDDLPIFERIKLPSNYLLSDFKTTMDEETMRVTVSSKYSLEFEPSFDEEKNILTIKIPLVHRDEQKRFIRQGIEYRDIVLVDKTGPKKLHLLYVDLLSGRYYPAILTAGDFGHDFLPVETMIENAGAVCGTSGGFFSNDGQHQGLIIRNGYLESYPKFDRPVFARTTDSKLHIGNLPFHGVLHGPNGLAFRFDAIDSNPQPGEVVLLTPGHPSRISSNLTGSKIVIANYEVENVTTENVKTKKWRYILWSPEYRDDFKQLKKGDSIMLEFGLGITEIEIETALGAGPMLISDGKVNVSNGNGFRNDITRGRAPRAGIGLTQNGLLILAVLEGRNPMGLNSDASIGATLEEFANILLEYGAVVAMNLDGGGSAAMAVNNESVSFYPGGSRPVTNVIAIFDKKD